MSNPEQQFGFEPPRRGGLTAEEREIIRVQAEARRHQADLKGQILALREQESGETWEPGKAYEDRVFVSVSQEMSVEEKMSMSPDAAADAAPMFVQKGESAVSVAPNLAAFNFAKAAQMEQRAGLDFAKSLRKARQYIEESAVIPKKSPNAFLPEAVVLGVEARRAKALPVVPAEKVAADIGHDTKLLADYALVLPEKSREKFLGMLPESERKKVSVFLDQAVSLMLKEGLISDKQERNQAGAVRRRAALNLETALRTPQSDPTPLIKALTETLYTLGDKESKDTLLGLGRKAMGGEKDKQEVARIFHTLINMDTHKGNSLAVALIGEKNLPDHVAWLFLKKLVKSGYLDAGLQKSWENNRGVDGLEGEKRFLQATRLIISELGINPDTGVLQLVLGRAASDLRMNVEKVKEQKATFEKIQDKDELVRMLVKDKYAATVYYTLFGGKTRFALVNSYNSEKFFTIVQVLDKLKAHQKPLREFSQILERQGTDKKRVKEIFVNIQAGRFPLGGDYAKEIRLDVSDSARLESLERQARGVFGGKQLGAVVKLESYRRYLTSAGDGEALGKLDAANGLADLDTVLDEIEKRHPEILDSVEHDDRLNKNWRKLGEKNVLNLSLRAALREQENQVSLRDLLANLEGQRKSLLSQYRQKSVEYLKKLADPAVRAEEKARVQEQILRVEEKGASKLLSYLLAETVGLEKSSETGEAALSPITQKVLAEWESHCEQVFGEYQSLDATPQAARKERRVTLRYLDKRKDLIEALRFADAAQCCFTSTQYRIEGHEVGNAEWIARIHKDPLSFIFEIEDNAPDAEKRSAVGFVFGSFAVQKNGPVMLLNGVYMEGKTDTAAQSIVNAIEQDFSRPLGMTRQFVAARHAGMSRFGPEYRNDTQTVRRLRAITSASTGEPEDQIYDDIAVGVNKEGSTDANVFYKDLVYG